jgi:hypothetical protein
VLKKFRNHVAHGTGGHLAMPVDSPRTISDVGEITNHLWGSPTPGGRLYPAPIRREIQTVAWSPEGSGVASGLASLSPDRQFAGWTTVLVRAVLHDDGLSRLDSFYETTTYPCDLLRGPSGWGDASSWLEQEHPAEDDVDVPDGCSYSSSTKAISTCRAAQMSRQASQNQNGMGPGTCCGQTSPATPSRTLAGSLPVSAPRMMDPARSAQQKLSALVLGKG